MSNYSERAKKINGGNGGDFVKFPVDMRLEAKVDINNVASFQFYDVSAPKGEQKKSTNRPVMGPLIGEAMRLEGYDEKAKVGYASTPYFNKQNRVAVFARGGAMGGKKVFEGNADDAAEWVNKQCGGVRKKRLWFTASLAGNPAKVSIIEISTSIVVAMAQSKKYKEEMYKNLMIFTPTHFDKNGDWDKDVKEILSALINNPRMDMGYADIKPGVEVDDAVEDKYIKAGRSIESIQNEFEAFKEFIVKGGASAVGDNTPTGNSQDGSQYQPPAPQVEASQQSNNQDDNFDLPF